MRVAQLPDATPVCHMVIKFLNRVVFMDEQSAVIYIYIIIFYFILGGGGQRGIVDAEITVSSPQISELSKILPVKSGASCNN